LLEILRRFRPQSSKNNLAGTPLDGIALIHVVLVVYYVSACIFDSVGSTTAKIADRNLCIKRVLNLHEITA